jgi:hypothetical protein
VGHAADLEAPGPVHCGFELERLASALDFAESTDGAAGLPAAAVSLMLRAATLPLILPAAALVLVLRAAGTWVLIKGPVRREFLLDAIMRPPSRPSSRSHSMELPAPSVSVTPS